MNIFHLLDSYEFFLGHSFNNKLVRIDILKSIDCKGMFRARVWIQNTYNLYPTFINTGTQGEDLKQTHSSDQICTEITLLVAEDSEWITGVKSKNAKEFFNLVLEKTIDFFVKNQ